MSKTTKILLMAGIMGLILLPYSYYYEPQIKKLEEIQSMKLLKEAKAEVLSGERFNEYEQYIKNLEKRLEEERKELLYLLPPFSTTRASLTAPFEKIRERLDGFFYITPEPNFQTQDGLVTWNFKFAFEGDYQNAVKLISLIEASNAYMELVSFDITESQGKLKFSGIIKQFFAEGLLK